MMSRQPFRAPARLPRSHAESPLPVRRNGCRLPPLGMAQYMPAARPVGLVEGQRPKCEALVKES